MRSWARHSSICVLGGLGSVPGALIGGLMLAIIERSARCFGPAHSTTLSFTLLILLLMVRPTGSWDGEVTNDARRPFVAAVLLVTSPPLPIITRCVLRRPSTMYSALAL